jgi:hypothetical protein
MERGRALWRGYGRAISRAVLSDRAERRSNESAPRTGKVPRGPTLSLSIVIVMRAGPEVIAFIAIIIPWPASFVAIVVMIVASPDPYADGTNIDFCRKCGGRKGDGGGRDSRKNVSTHGDLLLLDARPLRDRMATVTKSIGSSIMSAP